MRRPWHHVPQVGAGDAYLAAYDRKDPASIDYGTAAPAFGIGALVGILIGANVTFHSPVRRRR